MIYRGRTFAAGIMLAVLVGAGGRPVSARQKDTTITGKVGNVHLKSKVKAGDVALGPGRYEVQHVARGDRHFMVFREPAVPARGGIVRPEEVARVKCDVVPPGGEARKTGVLLGATPEGLRVIEEIYVRGENVKHVLTG